MAPVPLTARRVVAVACLVLATGCTSGSLASTSQADESLTAELAAMHAYWQAALDDELGDAPALAVADGGVSTGCGEATEDEGSFFCGADATVYLQQWDLDDLRALPPAQARAGTLLLLAHEYGHFLQDELAVPEPEDDKGPASSTVRYELQADCLAGAYLGQRGGDVEPGTFAAAVRMTGDDVGEDPLRSKEFEHGSGAQRVAAFTRGRDSGPEACGLE